MALLVHAKFIRTDDVEYHSIPNVLAFAVSQLDN